MDDAMVLGAISVLSFDLYRDLQCMAQMKAFVLQKCQKDDQKRLFEEVLSHRVHTLRQWECMEGYGVSRSGTNSERASPQRPAESGTTSQPSPLRRNGMGTRR